MSFFDSFMNAAREIAIKTHDYYATPPEATRAMLARERFEGVILEPCSGGGSMSRVLEEAGYQVQSSDIRDEVYGEGGIDVFSISEHVANAVTNPPGRLAVAVAEHLIGIVTFKVAILMKFDLYAGLIRRPFFHEHPPRHIYVFPERIAFWVGGDPNRKLFGNKDWAWYVWEVGYRGKTEIDRISIESETPPRQHGLTIGDNMTSFFESFAKAAREIKSTARRPGRKTTNVVPRDEKEVPERDLPESGDLLDGDDDFRNQLEALSDLVALMAESLPRFSPNAIPMDRVRKSIDNLERILNHASSDLK